MSAPIPPPPFTTRPLPPRLSPCVAVTLYGDLTGRASGALLDRLARAAAPGDLAVVVHDPPSGDERGAVDAVRSRDLRLWCAWGVDPDTLRAPGVAARVTRARAQLAATYGAEVCELNGEARWKVDDRSTPGHDLAPLAREMIAALRAGAPNLLTSWTSYDHPLWHRLPWEAIAGTAGVDLLALQYYGADPGTADPETHDDVRARMRRAVAQLGSLVARRIIRADLGYGAAGWTPYGQVHGLTVAGAAVVLDAAPVVRAWALPTRVDAAGLDALEAVLTARRLMGRSAGAIVRWQSAHGLAVDGVLGRRTLASIRAEVGR